MTPSTPEDALLHACRLIEGEHTTDPGSWPRTAARLIRLALERAVTAYWAEKRPDVPDRGAWRSRLLLLESYFGRSAARSIYALWCRLSDACHPHAYELAPTATELASWARDTADALQLLKVKEEGRHVSETNITAEI